MIQPTEISSGLTEIARAGNKPVEPYSGRGMVGTQCPGVSSEPNDQLFSFIADLFESANQLKVVGDQVDAVGLLSHALRRAKIDNMGSGFIMYFPNLPVDQ